MDWGHVGLAFGGAQKNLGPAGLTVVVVREDLLGHALAICPSAFNYQTVAANGSMYNTPPTYAIYMAGLVFDWLQRQGGIAAMERMPDKPRQELLVAIAGPLVNVVIALVLMAALGLGPVLLTTAGFDQGSLAERLLLVNIMLVVFNLIPAFPMDGGRVLRALLAMKLGAPRATAIAARIGQAFAVAFFVLGLLWSPILMVVGVFIYFAASAEEQQAAFTGFAARLTAREAMEPSPVVLDAGQPVSDAIDALLASPQKEFPVVDGTGRIMGLLDRDAMILGLRDKGAGVPVGEVMRGCVPVRPELPLPEAYIRMRQRGAAATIVADAQGRVLGVLTAENVAEMMMVESARPGWRFRRR